MKIVLEKRIIGVSFNLYLQGHYSHPYISLFSGSEENRVILLIKEFMPKLKK